MLKKTIILFSFYFFFIIIYCNEIDNAIKNNNYAEAERSLSKKIFLYPQDVDLRLKLAYVQLWQKKYKDSEFNFKNVINKNPEYKDGYDGLAKCYKWQNKTNEELHIILDAFLLFKEKKYALRLAEIYAKKNDYKKAKYYAKIAQDKKNRKIIDNIKINSKKWEFSAYYQFDDVKKKDFDNWQYNIIRIKNKIFSNTSLGIHYETYNRFNKLQQNIGFIFQQKYKNIDYIIEYYGKIKGEIKEKNKLMYASWWKINNNFIFTLDYKYSAYPKSYLYHQSGDKLKKPSSHIHTFSPGFEYYLWKNAFGGKINYIINEYKQNVFSYLLFYFLEWNEKNTTYLSYSFGKELYNKYYINFSGNDISLIESSANFSTKHYGIKQSFIHRKFLTLQLFFGFNEDNLNQSRLEYGLGIIYKF